MRRGGFHKWRFITKLVRGPLSEVTHLVIFEVNKASADFQKFAFLFDLNELDWGERD